jgi:glycosyltransferase involved in cell wall biosynthesis
MSRPKVLHVTTVDISLTLLIGPQLRAFAEAGYEIVTASADGDAAAELRSWGIRHVPLRHATRAFKPATDVRLAAELYRLFRAERPDLVHTHTPKPGWFGRPAARTARVPGVVNTVHGLWASEEDGLLKRSVVFGLERAAGACSDIELVQNPEDVETMRRLRFPERRLRLLGNGIDLGRFDPAAVDAGARARLRASWGAAPDDLVCGIVGRLVAEKGYVELFEAVASLRATHPGARLVVVGPSDDDKHDSLTAEVLDGAAAAGVLFLGHRHDVEELYTAFDAFVLPSWREGFPRAAMEAAAMGLPIIATDVRGCRQVCTDDHNGIVVPLRSAPAIAAAIARLADDPELRARLGAASRRRAVAEFDDRRCVEITLEAYREVLARRRR